MNQTPEDRDYSRWHMLKMRVYVYAIVPVRMWLRERWYDLLYPRWLMAAVYRVSRRRLFAIGFTIGLGLGCIIAWQLGLAYGS